MTGRPRTKRTPAPAPETTPDAAAASPPDAPRPASRRPRFPMSEGTREELARTGRAVDPFTGEVLENAERLAEVAAAAKARGESAPRRHA